MRNKQGRAAMTAVGAGFRRGGPIAVAAAAAIVLSACGGGDDTLPAKKETMMVTMRDGVKLATDVYYPAMKLGQTYPVLMFRTPYQKEAYGPGGSGLSPTATCAAVDPSVATKKGYIVVIQDVRGTWGSEGQLVPMNNEGEDGADTIVWAKSQAWSDGRVATYGCSYGGGTQMLAAPLGPAGLVAAYSQVAATDLFSNEWVYMDGVLTKTSAMWTAHVTPNAMARASAAGQAAYTADYKAINVAAGTDLLSVPATFESVWKTLPVTDMPVIRQAPWWKDWLATRDSTAYFQKTEMKDRLKSVAIPMMHVGGWYDQFLRNTLEHYEGITQGATNVAVRGQQRLVVGPWSHTTCNACPANSNVDGPAMQQAWLDQMLKGQRNALFDYPVIVYVMGEDRWRAERAWPLDGTVRTRYYLGSGGHANTASGDGTLSTTAPTTAQPADTYSYDPANPAPTLGGPGFNLGGRTLQNAAEARQDVLVYSTPTLTADTEVTGRMSARLYAASSATDTDWWIKLIDVAPNGEASIIHQGVARARYRASRTSPTALTPGKVEGYDIDMWASSNVFKAGHRIRVEVTSSNFPYADRNPNAFVNLNTATEKDFVVANQTVRHDADYASYVELPVIPASRERNWIATPFAATP